MPEYKVRARLTKEWSGSVEAATEDEAEKTALDLCDSQGETVDWNADAVVSQ